MDTTSIPPVESDWVHEGAVPSTLAEYAAAAERIFRYYDLVSDDPSEDWRFAWSRTTRVRGDCNWATRTIRLSRHYAAANDWVGVRDTILHEVAHALAGRNAGHGETWKRFARKVGADPVRAGDLGGRKRPVPARWRLTCPGCGRVAYRQRNDSARRPMACGACCEAKAGGAWVGAQ
jgi:predicted SprT family Zn-dependent metalloprotease